MRTNPQRLDEERHVPEAGREIRAADTERAFSLVEILVVMALLSVIVVGLMAMFNQTQRAFRLGMMQTDVLESGRLAADLLGREFQEITPSDQHATNFWVDTPESAPFLQPLLPGPGGVCRTNTLQDVFFITRLNQTWTGVGYYVRTNSSIGVNPEPVGTLYRFEASGSAMLLGQNLFLLYNSFAAGTNASKILDGVVHFVVRAYDLDGYWITNGFAYTNSQISTVGTAVTNVVYAVPPLLPGTEVWTYAFTNTAVPAAVEVELGILEQQAYEKYKSLPTYNARTNFLSQQAAHVHIFRQRIPIRNVDPSVYHDKLVP